MNDYEKFIIRWFNITGTKEYINSKYDTDKILTSL